MQACAECGHHNSTESIFCSKCGNKLNNNCPVCGFKNLEQQNFCGNCGKQMRTQGSPFPDDPSFYSRAIDLPGLSSETEQKNAHSGGGTSARRKQNAANVTSSSASTPASNSGDGIAEVVIHQSQQDANGSAISTTVSSSSSSEQTDNEPLAGSNPFTLKRYAKASIDIVNWEQLEFIIEGADMLASLKAHVEQIITSYAAIAGGFIEPVEGKPNTWQVVFQQQPSLLHSLQAGIDSCLQLLDAPVNFNHFQVQLRAGVGVEDADQPRQATATLERSISLPGALTVSEAVYEMVQYGYTVEKMGPVSLGETRKFFYRVLPFHQHAANSMHKDELADSTPPRASETLPVKPNQPESNIPEVSVTSQKPESQSQVLPKERVVQETLSEVQQSNDSLLKEAPKATIEQAEPSSLPDLPISPVGKPTAAFLPDDTEDSLASQRAKNTAVETLDLHGEEASTVQSDHNQDVMDEMSFAILREIENPSLLEEPVQSDEADNADLSQGDWYSEDEVNPSGLDDMSSVTLTSLVPERSSLPDALEAEPSLRESEEESDKQQQPEAEVLSRQSDEIVLQPEAYPESSLLSPEEPHFLDYEFPSLYKPGKQRPANISYQDVVSRLGVELESFLAVPPTPLPDVTDRGKLVFLFAEDGLGKSNIINIVRIALDPENQKAIWMGASNYRGYAKHADMPLLYWLELIQNLVNISFEGQHRDQVEASAQQLLGHVFEAPVESSAELLMLKNFLSATPLQPLSLDNKDIASTFVDFLFVFLTRLASKKPLVIMMEDLLFADSASLEVWAALLDRKILNYPVFIVFTALPEFEAEGILLNSIRQNAYQEFVVSRLSDTDTETFLNDGPFGGNIQQFPEAFMALLIDRAKGDLLYLEELVRLLHQQTVLTLDQGTGKFVPNPGIDLAAVDMPEHWDVLMQQRIRYLDEQSFYLLKLASAFGEKFPLNALMALVQLEQEPFNEIVTGLLNQGYLVPETVHIARFRHGKLWEFVYTAVEPELKLQFHQLISESLESDMEQGVTVNPVFIAYHAQLGGFLHRAVEYWNLGGVYYSQLGMLSAMNRVMLHGLRLLQQCSAQPLAVQDVAIQSVEILGIYNLDCHLDLSIAMLEWVNAIKQNTVQDLNRIEPIGFLASAYERQGNIEKALIALEGALPLVSPQKNPLEWLTLQLNKLEYLILLGKMRLAREHLEKYIEPVIMAQQNVQSPESECYDLYVQAQYCKAQIGLTQASSDVLTVTESLSENPDWVKGDSLQTMCQIAHAQVLLQNGFYTRCNHLAEDILASIEVMQDADWFLAQWGLLAIQYHCEFQDWESASQLVLTVLSKSEATQDYHTNIVVQAYAGKLAGKSGKPKEALRLIEKAVERSAEHRFARAALFCWRILAEFEFEQGNYELVCEVTTKALEVAKKPEIGNWTEVIQLTLLKAKALLEKNEVKLAGKLLEQLWPSLYATGINPLIALGAEQIGVLYKKLAQDTTAEVSRKNLTSSIEFFLKAKGIWMDCSHSLNTRTVDLQIPKL
jgi:tetratricopeptide (TPR) repeat protein